MSIKTTTHNWITEQEKMWI